MFLMVCFTTVLLLGCAWAEGVALRGREGGTVTLETGETELHLHDQTIWTFVPDPYSPAARLANLHAGGEKTDYVERFRGRLQLDRQTGSLTIKDIRIGDSGVYQGQIVGAKISSRLFHLNVYAPVSRPHIKQQRSVAVGGSCSVECSVKNQKDVTLSWNRGEERLNQTSSPDLSTNLSLSLEIQDQDGHTYSCVAQNPVDEKEAKLHSENACLKNGGSTWCSQTEATVRLAVSALVGVVLIVLLVEHFTKRRSLERAQ